jgi:hypothetical protein
MPHGADSPLRRLAMAQGTCRSCRYCREPARVVLFSDDDRVDPEVVKVDSEVREWQRQRRLDEDQRLASYVVFQHPPENYRWCEGYSRQINKYFTRQDARDLREALLQDKAEGARDVFDRVVGLGQELRDAARAGDVEAAARLDVNLRDRVDPVSGGVVSYFVPVEYFNGDGGCDRWERAEE